MSTGELLVLEGFVDLGFMVVVLTGISITRGTGRAVGWNIGSVISMIPLFLITFTTLVVKVT